VKVSAKSEKAIEKAVAYVGCGLRAIPHTCA